MVQVYAIRDVLAEEFGPPFCAVNDAVAVRAYRSLLANQGIEADAFKEYELVGVGRYDPKTGDVEHFTHYEVNVMAYVAKEAFNG